MKEKYIFIKQIIYDVFFFINILQPFFLRICINTYGIAHIYTNILFSEERFMYSVSIFLIS